ncbi:MAG TPA: FecR domain-containing protein [Syntrophorhabdaceae bacterium]|jgi:hypothetical protein
MVHLTLAGLVLFFTFVPVLGATAAEGAAAVVKTVSGSAQIQRQEKVIAAVPKEKLFRGDTLKTGKEATLGIIFKDDTILTLGPETTVVIDDFLFSPAEQKLSVATRMLRGTVSYISGIIGRLSPQSVRFETPVASVGIRGTKFLVRIEEEEAP